MGVQRLLVVDTERFILVEQDKSTTGWGVVKFAEDVQHVVATKDRGNPVCQCYSRTSIVPSPAYVGIEHT